PRECIHILDRRAIRCAATHAAATMAGPPVWRFSYKVRSRHRVPFPSHLPKFVHNASGMCGAQEGTKGVYFTYSTAGPFDALLRMQPRRWRIHRFGASPTKSGAAIGLCANLRGCYGFDPES
ncbi:MAG: hypothetical protein PHF70_11360, partial [Opitutales bacterium]|nr:hypothetical protein [Opitutales bacterium]